MLEMSRVQYGRIMEEGALKTLKSSFDSVKHIGKLDPVDILVSKQNVKIGINVKSGKTGYLITAKGLKRLIMKIPEIIPGFLFLNDIGSYLFQLVEVFPPVMVPEGMLVSRERKGEYRDESKRKDSGVEKQRCPECGETEEVVKSGFRLVRGGKKQRYQCKKCHRTFIPCDKTKGTMDQECLSYDERIDHKCIDCKLVEGDCGKELKECDTGFTGLDMQSEQCLNCHLYNVVLDARQRRGEDVLSAKLEASG